MARPFPIKAGGGDLTEELDRNAAEALWEFQLAVRKAERLLAEQEQFAIQMEKRLLTEGRL